MEPTVTGRSAALYVAALIESSGPTHRGVNARKIVGDALRARRNVGAAFRLTRARLVSCTAPPAATSRPRDRQRRACATRSPLRASHGRDPDRLDPTGA